MDNKRLKICAVLFWLVATGTPLHARAGQADEAKPEIPLSLTPEPPVQAIYGKDAGADSQTLRRISGPAAGDMAPSTWLNPDFLARQPVREFQLGSVSFTKRLSAGVNFREERDELVIPDLGSSGSLSSGFDAGSVVQDIHASSNRLQGQFPRKSAMRMNFLKLDNEEFRMDVTQHPSRTGLRFHHLGTGLRVEAERRYINSATSVFVGVRLLED